MRCQGTFKDDRVCDLCAVANTIEYQVCKDLYAKAQELERTLESIVDNCPYAKETYHDGEHFTACCKDGKNPTRYSEVCTVTIDCKVLSSYSDHE